MEKGLDGSEEGYLEKEIAVGSLNINLHRMTLSGYGCDSLYSLALLPDPRSTVCLFIPFILTVLKMLSEFVGCALIIYNMFL